jgi:hypothetical protein
MPLTPQDAVPPAGDPPAPPVPPWEAEQAAAALAEAKARDAQAGGNVDPAGKLAQREALLLEMELRTKRLEQEVDLLGRMSQPGSLSGLKGPQLMFSLIGWSRRPEWVILGVALFCFVMWFIAYTLRQWITTLLEVSRAAGQ